MVLLLIIPAWLLLLSLVCGLCVAARRGDLQGQMKSTTAPTETLVIASHAITGHEGASAYSSPSRPHPTHAVAGGVRR